MTAISTDVGVEPRLYQQQLFERAKTENVIACADTGTGKTLVAVLLLRWMLEEESRRRALGERKRISVMVVHHVPLVHQQGDYINVNSHLRVEKLYGELNIDKWNEEEWSKLLSEADVLVCTAQIVKDALAHSFLSFDDLNLLIFDEVHHATKDDVYARIMTSHYHTHTGHKPKIFGMTASPISSKSPRFAEAAQKLEITMDARIFTVPMEGWSSLAKATFKAKTELVKYSPPEAPFYSPMCQEIIDELRKGKKQDGLIQRLERLGPSLGPALCDHILEGAVSDGVPDVATLQTLQGLSKEEREHLKRSWNAAVEKTSSLEWKIKKLKRSTTEHAELKGMLKTARERHAEVVEERVSPKVARLVRLLLDIFAASEDRRGIIFAKEKATVHALAAYISSNPSLTHISVEALVGHTGPQGLGWKSQESVLRNFRRGDTHLLIATSVVEEGLDVPACNFVIRFDLPETAIQTIQSRGRARERGSTIYMMCEGGSVRDAKLIEHCRGMEQDMKDWLQGLTEDRLVSDVGSDGQAEFVPNWTETIKSEETGAKIEHKDAMSLLNWYVQALPKDEYTPASIAISLEEDETGPNSVFRCTLQMPAKSKLREVRSEWQLSKKAARQEAAFNACKQLFKIGELDNRLLPRKPERIASEVIEVKDDEGEVRLLKRHNLPRPVAKLFATVQTAIETRTFRITIIPFDSIDTAAIQGSVAPLLLLTSAEAPDDELSVELNLPNDKVKLLCRPGHAGTLTLTEDQHRLAKVYTLRLLGMVGRLESVPGPTHGSWMILPLDQQVKNGGEEEEVVVQWEQVAMLAAQSSPVFRSASHAESLGDDVSLCEIPDFSKPPSALYRVRDDLTPSSLGPRRTRQGRLGETFQQFYERVSGNRVDGGGPMLETRTMPRLQNFTTAGALRALSKSLTFLIPAVSYVHPVPSSVYRAAILLPSVLDRLNAMCLSRECQLEVLKDIKVPHEALLAALTAPSAGLSFSYQKFEFIGDSVLKLVATCHAFVSRIEADEGELTSYYMTLVSNRVLAGHSLRLKLWRYVCSDAFSTKTWAPPGYFVTDEEDGLSKAPSLPWSAKRLADIVEAILGSATTYTIDQKLQVALQLGLLPEEISSFAAFGTAFQGKLEGYMPTADMLGLSEFTKRLMERIQYKFEHPLLAINAVTHSSCMGFELPSYERLETLGDALLDFLVVEMLQKKYEFFEEGELTIVKANCVSNKTLAALAVSLGLHKHMNHHSSSLSGAIAAYVDEVTVERERELELGRPIPHQYWWSLLPPKALADIVESLLGAVLVDARFNLDVARAYFDRLYRPFLENFCRRENAILSSAESLFQLLLQRRCMDWCITGADTTSKEENGDAAAASGTVAMEEDEQVEENRLVRVMVHGSVCGDIKRGDKRFLERIEEAMKMLDDWRSDKPEAPGEGELLDVLRELWPGPLRTKKMCMPRLVLEAQCHCRPSQREEDDW
ncbi:hypothetical protein A4X06_0g4067 [Tilletia controversa]|uniref:Dicer-like protein 1 n=1 Tax=Tilletia controversa TaxID=13291 RepID=A0A8X7MUF8_9BASI|nr:hypothetical protein A4X06_0g4067 [Tilletia controversa]